MTKRDGIIAALRHCINDGDSVPNCEDCTYKGAQGTCPSLNTMLADAMALIEADRPMVMPLEAACGADYCYLERFNIDQVEPVSIVMWGSRMDGQSLTEVYRVGREGYELLADSEYGTHWRCWDKWPSDEDRMETPWS